MAEYPTEKELDQIRNWPHTDFLGMIDFVRDLTKEYGTWWSEYDTYRFSTGGWSGNEDIIAAMQENVMFWTICWMKSERGGHYEFKISE